MKRPVGTCFAGMMERFFFTWQFGLNGLQLRDSQDANFYCKICGSWELQFMDQMLVLQNILCKSADPLQHQTVRPAKQLLCNIMSVV